jgi:hypothetical protein
MAVFSGNGSNTAPSFTFSSTTNTGMYRPEATELAFTVAGTRSVTINNGPNLGINVTNPTARLHTLRNVGTSSWVIRAQSDVNQGMGFFQRANGDTELVVRDASDNNNYIVGTNGGLSLFTSNNQALRIESNSRITQGTVSDPRSMYNVSTHVLTDTGVNYFRVGGDIPATASLYSVSFHAENSTPDSVGATTFAELTSFKSQPDATGDNSTVTRVRGFEATGVKGLGAGSTVTEQIGFIATAGNNLATLNQGFVSDINVTPGVECWNFFAGGTAPNHFAGSLKIGGIADRATTEGTHQLVLFDGTPPVGTLANGVSFYSQSGEARVMDAAGNATLLSPHDSVTNEWIYDSTYTPTGKRLRIRMEAMMKALNEHFGWDFVEEIGA